MAIVTPVASVRVVETNDLVTRPHLPGSRNEARGENDWFVAERAMSADRLVPQVSAEKGERRAARGTRRSGWHVGLGYRCWSVELGRARETLWAKTNGKAQSAHSLSYLFFYFLFLLFSVCYSIVILHVSNKNPTKLKLKIFNFSNQCTNQ